MDKSTRIRLEKREETGKQLCKRARNEGKIPGVLYGPGYAGSLPFYVSVQSITPIVQSGRWETARLDVETPGGKKELCLMRDLHRNPLTGSILHVDLLQLKRGHKVSVNVPVEVTGREKCAGVKQGGIFEQLIHEIEMEVLPREIPASIVIDVTALPLDGVIRIADVQFPESAGLALSPEEVIVTIAQPRVEVEAAPEAVEEEETAEVEVVTKGKAKEEEV